jgi:hypothetical protein
MSGGFLKMKWIITHEFNSKIFNLLVLTLFMGTLILLSNTILYYYWLAPDLLIKIETLTQANSQLQKDIIFTAIIDQRNNDEYFKILKVLISAKKINGETCFKLAGVLQDISKTTGLSPFLLLAIATAESDLNPKCIYVNAKGLFQTKSCVKQEVLDKVKDFKYTEPIDNTLLFGTYINWIKELPEFINSTDEVDLVLAYRWGPFADKKIKQSKTSKNYINKVYYYYNLYKN